MVPNVKPRINVSRIIAETHDPVRAGIFLMDHLLLAERSIRPAVVITPHRAERVVRAWGVASYADLAVDPGCSGMINLVLTGCPKHQGDFLAISIRKCVSVPADLFALSAQITGIQDGVFEGDEAGLLMALRHLLLIHARKAEGFPEVIQDFSWRDRGNRDIGCCVGDGISFGCCVDTRHESGVCRSGWA